MRAMVLAFSAALFAIPCPSFSQEKSEPTVADLIARGKSHVQLHLKDAAPSRFDEVWPYRTTEGRRAVCGKVTSRGPDGSAPSNRRFAVSGSTVLLEDEGQFNELYGAWCFTPIADDGSIAHSPQRSQAYSTDLELKGHRIGDYKANLPSQAWTCKLEKTTGNEEICYSNPGSIGGVPCNFLSLTYYDGTVHSIVAFVEHKGFEQLKVAMIAKFGKPNVKVSEYQNAMGSTFSGATLEWPRDGGNLALIERASKLTQSAVIVQSNEYNALSSRTAIRKGISGVPDL